MGGRVVVVANQKGGVGKTTLVVHLARMLSEAGKRVVLVDADPQGNASSWVLDGDLSDGGLFRLLVVEEPLAKVVRRAGERWGDMALLPGNARTGEAMIFLASTGKPFDLVAGKLRPLTNVADFVLVDMPPSRAAGFQEMLFAADLVLVPTQLERMSLEGVAFMARSAMALGKDHGREPKLLGIVPNMVMRTVEHREQLMTLVKTFGQTVWPPLPRSIRVAEATAEGKTLFDSGDDEVTKAMRLVGQRFVENVGG